MNNKKPNTRIVKYEYGKAVAIDEKLIFYYLNELKDHVRENDLGFLSSGFNDFRKEIQIMIDKLK